MYSLSFSPVVSRNVHINHQNTWGWPHISTFCCMKTRNTTVPLLNSVRERKYKGEEVNLFISFWKERKKERTFLWCVLAATFFSPSFISINRGQNLSHTWIKTTLTRNKRNMAGNEIGEGRDLLLNFWDYVPCSPFFRPLATYIKIDIPQKKKKTWGVSSVSILITSTCWWSFVFRSKKRFAFGDVQTKGWSVTDCCDCVSNMTTDALKFNKPVFGWCNTQMINKPRNVADNRKQSTFLCTWECNMESKKKIV